MIGKEKSLPAMPQKAAQEAIAAMVPATATTADADAALTTASLDAATNL